MYLQGTIGYTILKNNNTHKKIIVFSDMHDSLPPCPFPNNEKIANWFKKKIINSKLLLEEIERDNGMQIEAIWENSSHFKDLRTLFLENKNEIEAVDIRPELIPYNWEVVEDVDNKEIKLKKYLKFIVNFFKLKNNFFIKKLKFLTYHDIPSLLKKHFTNILTKFYNYIVYNKLLLNKSILSLFKSHANILEEFNEILNDCMEWYMCALVDKYKNKTIMIHAGLYHTEKVNKLLLEHYKYEKKYEQGLNKITDKENYICQLIDEKNLQH